jgi:hypothetical protein
VAVRRVVPLALGLVLVAGLIVVVGHRAPEQAYTVAQVRAGLARQPAAWAGRTLLVRGIAAASSWDVGVGPGVDAIQFCGTRPIGSAPQSCELPLIAPNGVRTAAYLTLVDASVRIDPMRPFFMPRQVNALVLAVQPVTPNPLIALARRLPPLAHFLPVPGQVPGGVAHLYHIRLRPAGSARCASPFPFTCATGVLLDAQP